jgi:hypothetical protein
VFRSVACAVERVEFGNVAGYYGVVHGGVLFVFFTFEIYF